jgi:bile acid:Na+ symporter, BASS family
MADLLHLIEKLSVFAFLVSSMLGTGLSLTLTAVLAPLRHIRLVLLALGLNFILAPAFAWLLTIIVPLRRGLAIGLLLLGSAAGAPFLPTLAKAARGDLAFSVALMALLTVGTIVFMPLLLPLMVPGLQGKPWDIARPLLLLIVLPLAVGMLTAAKAAPFAVRAAPILMKVGNGFLLLLFVLLIALNVPALLGVVGSRAIAAVMLYSIGLLAAGWMLGGPKPELGAVIALGTAARNSALRWFRLSAISAILLLLSC